MRKDGAENPAGEPVASPSSGAPASDILPAPKASPVPVSATRLAARQARTRKTLPTTTRPGRRLPRSGVTVNDRPTAEAPRAVPRAPVVTARTASPPGRRPRTNTHHLLMLVSVALATLIAGIGGLYAAFAATRESTEARQGVWVGSTDVSGFSANQLTALVVRLAEAARVDVTYRDRTITGRLGEMGVTVDAGATVKAVLRADPGPSLVSDQTKWATQTVPWIYSLNETALNTWLMGRFGIDQDPPADAAVTFDADSARFVVTPSHAGAAFALPPLKQALDGLASLPQDLARATVTLTQQEPVIHDQAAAAAAQTANARLGLTFRFSVDGGATYTASPADLADWTQVTPNTTTGSLTVSYPAIVINAKLRPLLDQQLAQPGEPRRVVVDPTGRFLAEVTAGQPGVAVGDLTETARTVADLMEANRDSDLLVTATSTTPATVTTTISPAPTSGRWVDVDLTTQVATLMEGERLHRAYVVSSGTAHTPTPTGTFAVYSKVAVQTMNGYNADGTTYSIPDVPWATWFWGDYGFHAAYWLDESQIGTPQSHGCVNMRLADAKYLYDWLPTGAPVVIHGQTPDITPAPSPDATPH